MTNEGFGAWYSSEHPRLLAAMALASGDLDLAREVTDEAFARALERWGEVGAMASPGGWTYRVAINVVRRRQRRAALERRVLARHTTPPVVPEAARELWDVGPRTASPSASRRRAPLRR